MILVFVDMLEGVPWYNSRIGFKSLDRDPRWYSGKHNGTARLCTIEAAREDYGIKVPAKKGGAK